MIVIGVDRIGVAPGERRQPQTRALSDVCPLDGERGVFVRMALVCPRCGKVLGGI